MQTINKRHFRNTRRLRYLSLSRNKLHCLSDRSFDRLKKLETLELNDNKFSLFSNNFFDNLQVLKELKIENNPLYCDCSINYLIKYLDQKRNQQNIAPFMKCSGGRTTQGRQIDWRTVLIRDMKPADLYCPNSYSDRPMQNICREEPICPAACTCNPATSRAYKDVFITLDCRDRGLTHVPSHAPDTITQMRFEDNNIKTIGNREFSQYRRLDYLDLSNNQIEGIHENAFYGLKNLKQLLLYENRITSLAPRTFKGLANLEILMLNSNQLRCIQRDIVEDLRKLRVL